MTLDFLCLFKSHTLLCGWYKVLYFKSSCCDMCFDCFVGRTMTEVRNALKEAKKAMKDNDFEAVTKHCKVCVRYFIVASKVKQSCHACLVDINIMIMV